MVAERTGTPQHSQVKLLGNAHVNAVTSRDRLAAAYEAAGRFGEAIAAFQNALANREHNQGHEHPDTIAARALAYAHSSAGRPAEAVALYEQMADSADRQLGPGHPVTLTARAHLAEAYQAAARGKEALTAYQMLMTDWNGSPARGTRPGWARGSGWPGSERYLGPDHPMSKTTRENFEAATRT